MTTSRVKAKAKNQSECKKRCEVFANQIFHAILIPSGGGGN